MHFAACALRSEETHASIIFADQKMHHLLRHNELSLISTDSSYISPDHLATPSITARNSCVSHTSVRGAGWYRVSEGTVEKKTWEIAERINNTINYRMSIPPVCCAHMDRHSW